MLALASSSAFSGFVMVTVGVYEVKLKLRCQVKQAAAGGPLFSVP